MAHSEGKLFAVGDIHGCLDRLTVLLQRIPVDWGADRLIFLGDYVDRGPDSMQVIEFLLEFKRRHGERIVFLEGNHEWMFSRYLAGEDCGPFLRCGGRHTIESYSLKGKALEVPDSHREFLDCLEPFHETESYIFVHAGLRPGVSLAEQSLEDLLWIRSPFLESPYNWGKRVIFGHTPFPAPLLEENKIGIDTGAVYGGRLTAMVLPDLEFIFA
jgi:serine/threonine protein phosphatase 1